ncbi:hypothetical protein G6L37_00270 [Agrobacterium rubi]|nr:hypothetical protein [Agrobacterium rubi]NTF23823.1 hypothetical protein [Agrobacterium rubi]
MKTFESFRNAAIRVADERCNPQMTVAELDDALRHAAHSVIRDAGGAAAMFERYPELLSMSVDVLRFDGHVLSVGDVLLEVAAGSLLAVMQPVWASTLTDSFDEGFVAALEQTVAYVISAHRHARGTITEDVVDRLEAFLLDLAEGVADEDGVVDAMQACERPLRLLSNLPERSQLAAALGGAEEIRARHQVVVKLNLVMGSDQKDFLKWFGEELKERQGSSSSAISTNSR